MDGKTHLIAGGVAGVGLAYATYKLGITTDLWDILYLVGGSAIGSLIPDTDTNKSLLGRYVPLWIIFGHRKHTHSLFFMGLVMLLSYWLKAPIALTLGLGAGILSHLLLDMTTTMRLPYLFYPFFFRRMRLKIKFK